MNHKIAAAALALLFCCTAHAQDTAAAPHKTAATMKAVRLHAFGGPEVLKHEDISRPVPADDEILVRVHGAGVNPVDAKVRDGSTRVWLNVTLPFIPGWDVSGTVEEAGKNVKSFKPGDPVYAYINLKRGGGYSQYATVREDEAAPKPKKLSHTQAAAVPLAALTAWQALVDTAKIEKGQTVLIHGGSGGVGHFAIQIAKAKGCRVLATASAANLAFLKELGADEAIDYKAQKFEDIAKDVDVVLDSIGGETQQRSLGVLKKGGILVSIVGGADPAKAQAKGVRATAILVHPDSKQLAEIGTLIDAGKIKPTVSQTFPLAEASKAHEQIETRHTRGKVVLTVIR